MASRPVSMSRNELRELVESIVEQKLIEILGDADDGLELRKSVRSRLVRQQQQTAAGELGQSFDDLIRRLRLA